MMSDFLDDDIPPIGCGRDGADVSPCALANGILPPMPALQRC